jgi:hypothetical protein
MAALGEKSGRLDFLIKGACRLGKKQFPVIDLFRELAVEYREKEQGLINLRAAELVLQHDNIAAHAANFREACGICAFLLRNSPPGLPLPETFLALRNGLKNLDGNPPAVSWAMLIKLVYLKENGFLPDHPPPSDRRQDVNQEIIARLLAFARGKTVRLPSFPVQYLQDFSRWLDALCSYHALY